jgi:hypothetical protein
MIVPTSLGRGRERRERRVRRGSREGRMREEMCVYGSG